MRRTRALSRSSYANRTGSRASAKLCLLPSPRKTIPVPPQPKKAARAVLAGALRESILKAGAGLTFNAYARALFLDLAAEYLSQTGRSVGELTLDELGALAAKAAAINAERLQASLRAAKR